MQKNILKNNLLFRGLKEEEISSMLSCLQATSKSFQKGEAIYQVGTVIHSIGLILSGGVHIENNDVWGNKSLLEYIGVGQIFAESYACSFGQPSMVDVIAALDSEILFLNAKSILYTCPNTCKYHTRMIENLVSICAQKNIILSRRIFHTAPKSIRGKVLSYLSSYAIKEENNQFTIPFNRQQLADYLGVDRSALSNELSKMQKEGILSFHRNHFSLHQTEYK